MQQPIWLKLALSLAGFLSVANAQPPDRIYPIMQLTDRDVAEIDVTDGSVRGPGKTSSGSPRSPRWTSRKPMVTRTILLIWIFASGLDGTMPLTGFSSPWKGSTTYTSTNSTARM